ncbi:MAG: citrate transporter [Clostridia bacterium]|nr:citrate transporter [Clostridia bacterium]
MQGVLNFIKKEAVLCISFICAAVTVFFVPPDVQYVEYIDLHVLSLLLCLMAVVAGFQACGIFRCLTYEILKRTKSGRLLGLILVLLPFFSSMLVTNDVALLVFVPFTIGLLSQLQSQKSVIPILVLQTVAANLGSMATPVGNPQNLFLYSEYNLSASEFFTVTLPLTAVSLILLSLASLPVLPKKLGEITLTQEKISDPKKLAVYAVLFIVCLLTVFRVMHFGIMLGIVIIAILIVDRKILLKPDFALLATFVCFFIVSGNLGRIDAVNEFLHTLLNKNALLTATGASQIISNVPAAVLLSGFTEDWRSLLEGVNIGGLGTPIASLASLITLKLYLRSDNTNGGKFILVFLAANIIGLALLLGVATVI